MSNTVLFISSAMIWGTTWLMITFQLGEVPPLVSVVYRFTLASLLLFAYGRIRNLSYRFSRSQHLYIGLQGLLLYGFNYWLTYQGITLISSALAAVLSTSIVYFNVVFARIFLGDKIRSEVLIGATLGAIGIWLIFIPEIKFSEQSAELWKGISYILLGSILASLGNIVSAKTQRTYVPVVQANALSMGYAALLLAIIAFSSGMQFSFVWSSSYIASLIYLAVFGSVLAFGAFLTLLGRIGPDKAGYVVLVYPIIALIFSTLFENYQWTLLAGYGLLLIVIGNFVAMRKYRRLKLYKYWRIYRLSTPTTANGNS